MMALRAEDLLDLYWDLGWGLPRIAKELGMAPNTVRRLMLRAGIPTRHELSRWHRVQPWYLAVEVAIDDPPDPQDPAGYWACTRSSRAGVGCLLCREALPQGCGADCRACPPEVLFACPCFRHGDAQTRRERLGQAATYTGGETSELVAELGLDYVERELAEEPG